MYQTYSLTRVTDADHAEYATSFTTSDDDAINCAHMLAAGFNTMSRNFMGDFVLAVVDTKAAKPETASKYAHIARSVLEDAYAELQAVKSVVEEFGVETIPLHSGVREMQYMIEGRDAQIAEFAQARVNRDAERTAARAELIAHVKGAYSKWSRVDPSRTSSDLKSHLRGMLEVLSKFLVAIGEADADERHAAALRVCGIPEGTYIYADT